MQSSAVAPVTPDERSASHAAIADFERLVRKARPYPLVDQIRLRREVAEEALEAILGCTPAARDRAAYAVRIGELTELVRNAPVASPLRRQIRLDEQQILGLLAEIRAALG